MIKDSTRVTKKKIGTFPRNWAEFLKAEENKKELFTFLSHEMPKLQFLGKEVVVANVCL